MKANTTRWSVIILVVIGLGFLGYSMWDTPIELSGTDAPTAEKSPTPKIIPDEEYIDEEIDVAPDTGITTDDILRSPDTYEGVNVNVKAEVEEWINSRAIVLDAPGIVDDNLLVVTREPTYIFEDSEIFGDAIWEVVGTVKRFTFVEARDTLDVDFAPDIFMVYEGKPYIVAESIELYED